jgi:hypothetical protein
MGSPPDGEKPEGEEEKEPQNSSFVAFGEGVM